MNVGRLQSCRLFTERCLVPNVVRSCGRANGRGRDGQARCGRSSPTSRLSKKSKVSASALIQFHITSDGRPALEIHCAWYARVQACVLEGTEEGTEGQTMRAVKRWTDGPCVRSRAGDAGDK